MILALVLLAFVVHVLVENVVEISLATLGGCQLSGVSLRLSILHEVTLAFLCSSSYRPSVIATDFIILVYVCIYLILLYLY